MNVGGRRHDGDGNRLALEAGDKLVIPAGAVALRDPSAIPLNRPEQQETLGQTDLNEGFVWSG